MRPFKSLPWESLFLSALVTMAIVTVVDYLLYQGLAALMQSAATIPAGSVPLAGLFQQVAPPAAGFGVGALALYLTAEFFREVPLRANTLWALNGCLILLVFIKVLLPFPGLLVYPEMLNIVMMVVGVFIAGKRYWRY